VNVHGVFAIGQAAHPHLVVDQLDAFLRRPFDQAGDAGDGPGCIDIAGVSAREAPLSRPSAARRGGPQDVAGSPRVIRALASALEIDATGRASAKAE
jgi:hypothetical protein